MARSRRLLTLCLLVAVTLSLAAPVFGAGKSSGEKGLNQGLQAFKRGNFEAAISSWATAAEAYEREGRPREQLLALTHLAEAYSALGRYREAGKTLGIALDLAERSSDRMQIAAVLSRLGTVHAALGEAAIAEGYLTRGLRLARDGGDRGLTAALLNDLGNVLVVEKRDADALAAYQESATLAEQAGRPTLAARALTNAATTLHRTGRPADAEASLDVAVRALRSAGPSHEVGLTLVSAALAYQALRASRPEARDSLSLKAAAALREAAAASAGDRRTASYAWGYLGALYEEEHRYNEALELTRRATFAAQQVTAPESLYRWQWQSGRVLKKLGSTQAALAAYRRAVTTLQSIRPELIREGAVQGSFRETLGPLYLELVDLLLQQAATTGQTGAVVEPLLTEARDVVELFKVAELRDYFRDDCVDLALAKVTKLDVLAQSAV